MLDIPEMLIIGLGVVLVWIWGHNLKPGNRGPRR
jgi:hypothetical protein